jgi:hypothetical protein
MVIIFEKMSRSKYKYTAELEENEESRTMILALRCLKYENTTLSL